MNTVGRRKAGKNEGLCVEAPKEGRQAHDSDRRAVHHAVEINSLYFRHDEQLSELALFDKHGRRDGNMWVNIIITKYLFRKKVY